MISLSTSYLLDRFADNVIFPAVRRLKSGTTELSVPSKTTEPLAYAQGILDDSYKAFIASRAITLLPAAYILFLGPVCPMLTTAAAVISLYCIADMVRIRDYYLPFHEKGLAASCGVYKDEEDQSCTIDDIRLVFRTTICATLPARAKGWMFDIITTRLLTKLFNYTIYFSETQKVGTGSKKILSDEMRRANRAITAVGALILATMWLPTAPVSATAAAATSLYAAYQFRLLRAQST